MSEPSGMQVSREVWEQEYEGGRWKYLDSVPEMSRYAVIAAYVRRFSGGGPLLDVGSGEGVLCDYLDWSHVSHYTGIDLSTTAIERARAPEGRANLIAADVEEHPFSPEELFDVIVFNEVLSYPARPVKVIDRLKAHLSPAGIVIVSLWHSTDANSPYARTVQGVWKAIDEGDWKGIDETAVTNIPTRRTWRIRVMSAAI